MNNIKAFFSNKLGFDFNKNLESKDIYVDKALNHNINSKLRNNVYYYKNINNTNTSFYLITAELNNEELEDIRRYIWNKNDADIIFYNSNKGTELVMCYAKYSPKITYKESILETFPIIQKDLNKIEKIKHWQFDSGVFWFNYSRYIDKAKYKGIDKELVYTLEALKKQLDKYLLKLIPEEVERNEKVQALIDRTLYIKYLEDNHIINSHFYGHYFNDKTLNYEQLLVNNSNADLNILFQKIHEIFNNALFEHPTIDNNYLTQDIRQLIATSFKANLNTGQLRLFDFQFDVLPVEFISYIYEVFLSEKQKKNGIYYTPKKLAQLIIDEVINEDKIGSILDPSSGSGMFLTVGYQRLLEIAQKQGKEDEKSSIEKIKFRTQLLAENIFGIEKELTAQRFTLFSLSLQIFKGINPEDIKNFIADELEQNKKINLFSEFSFFENIKHANTLNVNEKPFEQRKFSYIVGNPPFFEIPKTDEFNIEISFLNSFKASLNNEKVKTARDIVGKSQISQCFFLKIKDWADDKTRFGFVSNSSNFYNDYSENFQNYFYSNYGIEKIYELSRVKKILFEKAKESVVALIFTNTFKNNISSYYPIELGLYSEKPFELLIIQEDKVVPIEQSKLIYKELRLRDFLIGNEYDRNLVDRFNRFSNLNSFLNIKKESLQGLTRKSNKEIANFLKIKISDFNKLKRKEKKELQYKFELSHYLNETQNELFPTPYIYEYTIINHFTTNKFDGFINLNSITKTNFQRQREENIFKGQRILITRVGNSIKAVYFKSDVVYSVNIFGLKVKDQNLYYFVTALFNSSLVNYIINQRDKKRIGDNLPRISGEIIKNIPVPKDLEQDLVRKISDLSKSLSEGEYEYPRKKGELNELIYELYELSYWEKQRVEDYFLPKERIGRKRTALNRYKSTLYELLEFYFKNPITIEETSTDFNLVVIKISLNQNFNNPIADQTKKYILNEIFEQNSNDNFLASQEKIYGKDCVYIIKEDINNNWTETKAFEDGQDLLKHLIYNENGERIH